MFICTGGTFLCYGTIYGGICSGRNGRVKPYGSLDTGFGSGIYANARERSMDLEPVNLNHE